MQLQLLIFKNNLYFFWVIKNIQHIINTDDYLIYHLLIRHYLVIILQKKIKNKKLIRITTLLHRSLHAETYSYSLNQLHGIYWMDRIQFEQISTFIIKHHQMLKFASRASTKKLKPFKSIKQLARAIRPSILTITYNRQIDMKSVMSN